MRLSQRVTLTVTPGAKPVKYQLKHTLITELPVLINMSSLKLHLTRTPMLDQLLRHILIITPVLLLLHRELINMLKEVVLLQQLRLINTNNHLINMYSKPKSSLQRLLQHINMSSKLRSSLRQLLTNITNKLQCSKLR